MEISSATKAVLQVFMDNATCLPFFWVRQFFLFRIGNTVLSDAVETSAT